MRRGFSPFQLLDQGVDPQGILTTVYGGRAGKSYLLDMASCLSRGADWRGLKTQQEGAVLGGGGA